MKDYSI